MSTIAEFDFNNLFQIIKHIFYLILKIPIDFYSMFPTWLRIGIKIIIILITIFIGWLWYKSKDDWKKVYWS